jgi:hypothetical protein
MFTVLQPVEGSPSAACGQFCYGDVVEAVDSFKLNENSTFGEFEALVLGQENSPVSFMLDRQGQKVYLLCACPEHPHRALAD